MLMAKMAVAVTLTCLFQGLPQAPVVTFDKEYTMTDKSVLIIATFSAKPGQGDALFDVLNPCVAPSREEAGNVHYDLYRSVENPDAFLFHETWKSHDAIAEHEKQPHFLTLIAGVAPLIAAPPVITKI